MTEHASKPYYRRGRLAWLVGTVSCVLFGLGGAWALAQSYPPLVSWSLARFSGWLSLVALSLSLCVSPVLRLSQRFEIGRLSTVRAPELRRLTGMASAWLALVHLALGFIPLHDEARASAAWLLDTAHVRAGLSALLVLLALLLSSFAAVVRGLHLRAWKELHRLAYVAFACAVQHVLLSPFAPRAWVLSLFAVICAIGLLRLLPRAVKGRV